MATLDAAWAEAEAACPTEWYVCTLSLDDGGDVWVAQAEGPGAGNWQDAKGSTPAAALQALAVALRSDGHDPHRHVPPAPLP